MWTTHFFDDEYEYLSRATWINNVLVYFFKEVVHRIWECMPIIKWLELLETRHDSDGENKSQRRSSY